MRHFRPVVMSTIVQWYDISFGSQCYAMRSWNGRRIVFDKGDVTNPREVASVSGDPVPQSFRSHVMFFPSFARYQQNYHAVHSM